jgi:flagellar biosynthesis protein FlhB
MSSEERTEKPTQKKMRDAWERGQVARSKEAQDVVQLAAALMTLTWVGGYMVSSLADRVGAGITRIDTVAHQRIMPAELTTIVSAYLGHLTMIVGPVMATALVAGLLAVKVQGGWNVSWEPLSPSFGRLNPVNGLKRLLPARAGVDLLRVLLISVALVWVSCGRSSRRRCSSAACRRPTPAPPRGRRC